MPCMESPCVRCDTHRGGFRFPFVGIWTMTKKAVLAQTGEGLQAAWNRYHGREETFELLALQRLASMGSCPGTDRASACAPCGGETGTVS